MKDVMQGIPPSVAFLIGGDLCIRYGNLPEVNGDPDIRRWLKENSDDGPDVTENLCRMMTLIKQILKNRDGQFIFTDDVYERIFSLVEKWQHEPPSEN